MASGRALRLGAGQRWKGQAAEFARGGLGAEGVRDGCGLLDEDRVDLRGLLRGVAAEHQIELQALGRGPVRGQLAFEAPTLRASDAALGE